MAEVSLNGRVRFLRAYGDEIQTARRQLFRTHLVQAVGECFISTRCRTEDSPVVYYEFVTARRSLTLRNNLECADNFDSRLECEGECFVCLRDLSGEDTLEVARAVAEDNEDDLLLITETVHPSRRADALRPEGGEVRDLRLREHEGMMACLHLGHIPWSPWAS